MAIYIFNILSIPVYSLFIKNRRKYVAFVSLQMFLILALRNNEIGVDLGNYIKGFEYISRLNFSEMISKLHFFRSAELVYPFVYESGYVVLNWIVAYVGLNFHGLLVVCAAINMFAVGYFIYRFSKLPWLSFVIVCGLGIYTYMFGIIRQSMALSMFIFAITSALDKKYWKALIMSVLAFTFHRAAVVTLPLFLFIPQKQIDKNKYIGILICWLGFVAVSNVLYRRLVVPVMLFFRKYYEGHMMQWNNLILLLVLIALATILFCNFSTAMNEKVNIISAWAIILAIYLETIGMFSDNLARSVHCYTIFAAILIPHVLTEYHNEKVAFFAKEMIILLLCGYMAYSLNNTVLVPYRTIWSLG